MAIFIHKMDSILDVLSWMHLLVSVALYFVTLVFYRLYLHPLARFPGPRLAAITRYFEAYYDVVCNGQYTFKIAEMHKKYGPIIRISPHELHISDPSFCEKLYNHDGPWDKYDWSWDAFGAPLSTICTVKHDIHKRRRAALNPFFSKASVANRIDIIQRSISGLCHKVDELSGSTSDRISLGVAISAFTRDVSIEFAIGRRYHILDAQDLDAEVAVMPQTSGSLWQRSKHFLWYVFLMSKMPSFITRRTGGEGVQSFVFFLQDMMKVTMEYYTSLTAAVPSADAPDETPPTIVHKILNAQVPSAEKSLRRVFEEVGTITRGGFETVANTLRMTLYHIYANQEILRRLRSELADARDKDSSNNNFGSSDLRLRTLEKLPYLTAVLTEGLRLSPGLSTRAQRIAPDRDLVYDGWTIPAGTPVGMTTLLMHHDPVLYPDPRRFDPERWVDLDVRRKAERTYAPFGRGTRMCLGMHLAWAELYMLVAALVQRFDFEFEPTGVYDVLCSSDQFIIGTSGRDGLQTSVSRVRV